MFADISGKMLSVNANPTTPVTALPSAGKVSAADVCVL